MEKTMNEKIIRQSKDLVEAGLATEQEIKSINRVITKFALSITPQVVQLFDADIQNDPIALQYIPSENELYTTSEETADPIGDNKFTPIKGIIHRYPDRVLLKLLHVCAVYCRFCFRREQVGPGSEFLSEVEKRAAFEYIKAHKEIWEVILSGGDPLILTVSHLAQVMRELSEIPHVEVIRFHTRVPVADSRRITQELVKCLKINKAVYIVIHCNHPRELSSDVVKACASLIDAGIPLLSQTVLLKGVNDRAEIIEELLRKLVALRIKPYYLHQGDLAPGTSHFRTSIKTGQNIMREIRGKVSGLCQPNYVLDIPGGFGKVPIGPSYLRSVDSEDEYVVEDCNGQQHFYPPKSNVETDGRSGK